MSRNVQISEELFLKLCRYFLIGATDQEDEIRQQLQEKLEKAVSRDLYSKYKTAPTPEERERARQEYLNSRGIPTDFRW